MKTRTLIIALAATVACLVKTHAGDLNVVGNLGVASNLTANALTANTMAVNTISLGGDTRTNWPSGGGTTVNSTDLNTAVLDFSQSGRFYRYTLTSDTTWALTNHVAGQQVWLQVAQDSTGGWMNTWPADLLWSGGQVANVTATPNHFSVFKILDNGTSWLAQAESLDYSIPCVTNCNYGLQFDGSQNYITIPGSSAFATSPATWEAWVKPPAAPSGNEFFWFAGWAGQDTLFVLLPSMNLAVAISTTDNIYTEIDTTTPLTAGAWNHVAFTYTSGEFKVWVNGVQDGSTATPTGDMVIDSSLTMTLGGRNDQSYWFVGSIDEVRISNIVRYSDTFTPTCTLGTDSNTVAYWKFDHSSDPTVTDASGNGHDGTMQGSPLPTWVSGVTCTGGGSMNIVSRGGSSMLLGRGTTGLQPINLRPITTPVILSNSPTMALTNSPVTGSSITITDTLGRVWGLLSHP